MRGIIFFILLFLFCFTFQMRGQKPAAFIEKGDAFAAEQNWDAAFAYYNEAYSRDSSTFDHVWKLADAARRVKDYPLALRLFREAYDRDAGKLYPDGLFYMAWIEKVMGDYESALRDFKKYTKKNTKNKKSYFYKKAMAEIESCTWAMQYKNKEEEREVVRLNYDANKGSENFSWMKDSTLWISVFDQNKKQWEIREAKIEEDSLIVDVKTLSTPEEVSVSNIVFDKRGMAYFTLCDTSGCAIWRCNEKDLNLRDAVKLYSIHEDGSTSTMPFIAEIEGRECLFFVSDRKGGKGKMDIWYAFKSGDNFINPENCGDIINTPDDELSPFYTNGVLYFSSEWHKGFGAQDIFKIKGAPGMWGSPENLGLPINSTYNDIFYREIENNKIFLSSNRLDDFSSSTCCNDVFKVVEPKKDSVFTKTNSIVKYSSFEEINNILPVTLYFHNDEPNARSVDTTTQVLYSEAYSSYLERLTEYQDESAKGLSGEKREDALSEVEDFFQLKVKKGMDDLNEFVRLLNAELEVGNSITLSIRGFASPRAKSDYNRKLTQRRIQSLINELKVIQDSLLYPYIAGTALDGTLLKFEALPFGEDKSSKQVVDALNDTKGSIYSRSARLERKIEIQAVKGFSAKSIVADKDYHNFGKIGNREVVFHTFVLENASDKAVKIDSVLASCGCTEPQLVKDFLLPGEQTELRVGYNPFGASGREIKQIMIYVAGEKPRILMIEAEVGN